MSNTLAIAAIAALLSLALACGGSAIDTARKAVDLTAQAGKEADSVIARHYADAARKALEESQTMEDYLKRMDAWDKAVDALTGVHAALIAAEAALDTWESIGDSRPFIRSAGCLATALHSLMELMQVLGVPIPDPLEEAVELARSYVGLHCRD